LVGHAIEVVELGDIAKVHPRTIELVGRYPGDHLVHLPGRQRAELSRLDVAAMPSRESQQLGIVPDAVDEDFAEGVEVERGAIAGRSWKSRRLPMNAVGRTITPQPAAVL